MPNLIVSFALFTDSDRSIDQTQFFIRKQLIFQKLGSISRENPNPELKEQDAFVNCTQNCFDTIRKLFNTLLSVNYVSCCLRSERSKS